MRSLSLAHLPERRNSLAVWAACLVGLVVVAIGAWYLYGHFGPGGTNENLVATTESRDPRPEPATAADPSDHSPGDKPSSAAPRGVSGNGANPAPPAKGDIALEAKGYIVPAHQILVSPKVSGMIVKLNIEEGRRVGKGESRRRAQGRLHLGHGQSAQASKQVQQRLENNPDRSHIVRIPPVELKASGIPTLPWEI